MPRRIATKVEAITLTSNGQLGEATTGVHQECKYAVVDVAADSTTVSSVPCIVYGIYVNTVLSAHALPIMDGSSTPITLVASLAAGSNLQFPFGVRYETSLIVDPNDAATGNITVFYKPL